MTSSPESASASMSSACRASGDSGIAFAERSKTPPPLLIAEAS